jgi:hypothetical protein
MPNMANAATTARAYSNESKNVEGFVRFGFLSAHIAKTKNPIGIILRTKADSNARFRAGGKSDDSCQLNTLNLD